MEKLRGETLAGMIRQRINDAYDGNQSEFARAIDSTPNTVSIWLRGKVQLPEAEARRRLAIELGITPIELLVLAGVITPDEVEMPIYDLPGDGDLRFLVDHWRDLDRARRQAIMLIARDGIERIGRDDTKP